METPKPTGEPDHKQKSVVHFDDDSEPCKRTKPNRKTASEGVCRKEWNGDHAKSINNTKNETSGKTPLEAYGASSPTLDGSPGLLPNVTENELQLNQVQEPARTPGISANNMNNEPI